LRSPTEGSKIKATFSTPSLELRATAVEHPGIWKELERTDAPLARHLCELRKHVPVTVTLDEWCSHEGSAQILRARANIKRDQAATACSRESRSRFELMGSAISRVIDWWDSNRSISLRHVCLAAEPDVCFVLWFRIDNETFLAGFESRNATKLTLERGKAFFGNDWTQPDPGL